MEGKTKFAIIGVVVIAIVIAATFMYLYNEDEQNESSRIGNYFEYDVTGFDYSIPVKGTVRTEVIDETPTQYKVKNISDLYKVIGGVKTPFMVNEESEWRDIDNSSLERSWGVKQDSETIDTKWGSTLVDVYLKTDGSNITNTYVSQGGRTIYKTTVEGYGGSSMEMNLSSMKMYDEIKS